MNILKNKSSLFLIILLLGLAGVDVFLGKMIWDLRKKLELAVPEVFVVEEYRPANIVVNAGASLGKIKPFWKGFAQGGEEMGGSMLASTVPAMKQISPSYVRLDHIFDDDYYGVVKGPGQYDFSKLDAEVDRILAMGAKPFFSLGYMPSALADSKISVPHDWGQWGSLVAATVAHYSGEGGKNLSGVYYEVWNEPDLESFGAWKRGGEKSYLTMYSVSARAAMGVSNANHFYFGGPATTALYRNWVIDLINFCVKNKLKLDFISWHRYSFSPNQFLKDIQDTYKWLGANRDYYDWIITEWGPTPEKSGTYGSRYAAAHAFATVRRLLGLGDLLFAFEVKDGPEQGDMGWGVLAHDSAGLYKKPRYYAFSWLNMLAGAERLSLRGEGTRVSGIATGGKENSSVFLTNFDSKGSNTEKVPIKVVGMPRGQYKVTKKFLFSKAGGEEIVNSKAGEVKTEISLAANDVAWVNVEFLNKVEGGDTGGMSGFGELIE